MVPNRTSPPVAIAPAKSLQSGLMLQLDGDDTAAAKTTDSSKYMSLTGRPREEERLRVLETKERNHSEELAVRSTCAICLLFL